MGSHISSTVFEYVKPLKTLYNRLKEHPQSQYLQLYNQVGSGNWTFFENDPIVEVDTRLLDDATQILRHHPFSANVERTNEGHLKFTGWEL